MAFKIHWGFPPEWGFKHGSMQTAPLPNRPRKARFLCRLASPLKISAFNSAKGWNENRCRQLAGRLGSELKARTLGQYETGQLTDGYSSNDGCQITDIKTAKVFRPGSQAFSIEYSGWLKPLASEFNRFVSLEGDERGVFSRRERILKRELEIIGIVSQEKLSSSEKLMRLRDVLHAARFDERQILLSPYDHSISAKIFLRLGHLFYLDASAFEKLSENLQAALRPNLILLDNLPCHTLGEETHFQDFTMTTVLALSHAQIAGNIFVDAGAGDGSVALAAAKLGARRVILIDNAEAPLRKAQRNFLLNEWPANLAPPLFLKMDLKNSKKIAAQIKAEGVIVVAANIGDWQEYGEVNNLTALSLVRHLKNVKQVILGGYETERPEHFAIRDLEAARKMGYKANFKIQSGMVEAHVLSK